MLDIIHRTKADIIDVFSSIQGEGIFLGAKQIFVRFKKCNLSCAFCDEKREGYAREYTPLELVSEVKFLELSQGPHHSVSLTGGEPLLYTDFLKVFLKLLKKEKLRAYLETNGTLPAQLREVAELVDIVAMDIKLPSSTGERAFWKEHLEFLRIAARKKVFVKAVVTAKTTERDIKKAASVIRRVNRSLPLILQPAAPAKKGDKGVDKSELLRFMEIGSKGMLRNIRVIPQAHKALGVK